MTSSRTDVGKGMNYDITLIEAQIAGPTHGTMRLGLDHEGDRKADLVYKWDESHFTATFVGNAGNLPRHAHPVVLLSKPIAAIYALKSDHHRLLTNVFKDHLVAIEIS